METLLAPKIKTDISEALGLQINFEQIQSSISLDPQIKQVFVLPRATNDGDKVITAFIETVGPLSNYEKQELTTQLKRKLEAKHPYYLIPCTFVYVNELPKRYTLSEFEGTILQNRFMAWDVYNTQSDFWAGQLKNLPHFHNLPVDKVRPLNHLSSRASLSSTVDIKSYKKILKLIADCNQSEFVFMQTILVILLARYSNDSDLIMLSSLIKVTDDENLSIFDDLILRSTIIGNPKFKDFLSTNGLVIKNAFQNNLPFKRIIEKIALDKKVVEQAFRVKISFTQIESNHKKIEKVINDSYENKHFAYDLELSIAKQDSRLVLRWFFNANLFEIDTIQRMNDSFLQIFHTLSESFDTPIFSIPLIEPNSLKERLNTNFISSLDNEFSSIYDCFETQATKYQDRVALIHEQQFISYSELFKSAAEIAQQLTDQINPQHKIIAVCLDDQVDMVKCILAIIKSGACYLAIEPSFPAFQKSNMLNNPNIAALITSNSELELFDQHDLDLMTLRENNRLDTFKKLNTTNLITSTRESKAPAYMMYTSGSTNKPKSVLGTHSSIINRVQWFRQKYSISHEDRFCLRASLSSVDHVAEIFQPLASGAALVLFDRNQKNDCHYLVKMIKNYVISHFTVLPSVIQTLTEASDTRAMANVKVIISSGEQLFSHTVRNFYKKFGPHTKILNLYGSTETGADTTYHEVDFSQDFNVLNLFSPEKDATSPTHHSNKERDIYHELTASSKHDDGFTLGYTPCDGIKDRFRNTSIPKSPISIDDYIKILNTDLTPYLVDVSSEKYIGHMTSPLPNYIPDFNKFIAKANQNVVKIETSKSMTFLERQVLCMLHQQFFEFDKNIYHEQVQNSDYIHGIFTSGGSLSNITALYCARQASLLARGISKKELLELGAQRAMKKLGFTESVILVSQLAHYSIKKAASLIGIGESNIKIIEQDEKLRVNTKSLQGLIKQCQKDGKNIIAIIGIAGATETGTIDPLTEIGNIARQHSIHFHVDAAWGGAFIFSDKYKHKLKGIEKADSITICAHKQLYISQGLSACIFKDPKKLFSITTHAEYQSQQGSFDLGQFTLEGSRPGLSLLLHASLHLLSKNGYAQLVEQSMEKASFLSEVIESSECFELVSKNDLNIVNYRYIPKALRDKSKNFNEKENREIDAVNEQIQKEQFIRGKTFVSKTRISPSSESSSKITVFRVVFANPNTSFDDILDVLSEQLELANDSLDNRMERPMTSAEQQQLVNLKPNIETVPIGKPIDNVNIYILDKFLNPVPIGVVGEVYVSGACLARGYLENDELNDRLFIKNPFLNDGSLMFKSGDLAKYLNNSEIEYLGRKDLQIKLNGHRMKLQEIKSQLDKNKYIKNSIVLVENDLYSDPTLIAHLEIKDEFIDLSEEFLTNDIREQLSQMLPDFMIPKTLKIQDSLPKTFTGKVDFNAL